MSQVLLRKLKKKLPRNYSKIFGQKARPVSIRRFRAVLNGEVTDPVKIMQVIKIAEKILTENDKINNKIQSSGNKILKSKVN